MYEKAEKGALAEHEWLEVLLFGAIPRKNTNEIAHRLIAQFGSALDVFLASSEDLQKVPGVGPSVAAQIRAIGHFYREYKEITAPQYRGKFSSRDFLPFVKQVYKDILYEVVDLYLLDGEGRVVKKRRFSVESICRVKVLPEDVSSFLLSEGASGAVMVHNHPYGEAIPSDSDDRMTKNCQMLCSMHNRLFCDHIIYAPNGMYSYYLSGRMKDISQNYSVCKFLGDEEEE
jgi:DNA repair protein RadC